MDVSQRIRLRLSELGLDQKDLAAAAEVTDSYISQLLTRKKAPPAPSRTDVYEKMGRFLELPAGELARLAEEQRRLERRRKLDKPPRPLFGECRELLLRKCHPETRPEVRRIFEQEAFGELERLVTQKTLEVTQSLAREELRDQNWLRTMGELSGRSYHEMRVELLEFLDSDALHVSPESCVSFLDPMIDAWDIDLPTFALEFILNSRLAPRSVKRFEFVEVVPSAAANVEPGFEAFLKDPVLSAEVTEDEIAYLKALTFAGRSPTALYYYRELQSLRDPLHFMVPAPSRPNR